VTGEKIIRINIICSRKLLAKPAVFQLLLPSANGNSFHHSHEVSVNENKAVTPDTTSINNKAVMACHKANPKNCHGTTIM